MQMYKKQKLVLDIEPNDEILTLDYNKDGISDTTHAHSEISENDQMIDIKQEQLESTPPLTQETNPLFTPIPNECIDIKQEQLESTPPSTQETNSIFPPIPNECYSKHRSVILEYLKKYFNSSGPPTDPPLDHQAVPTRPDALYETILNRKLKTVRT